MDKAREAMLRNVDDIEKSKGPHNSPLDADWLRRDVGKGDYWGEGVESKKRDFTAAFGHLTYTCLLIAELALWILVLDGWRSSPRSTHFISVFLPLLLPSLLLPALSTLHSLTKGRLSIKEGLMMLVPPSPALIHLALAYRALTGKDRISYSLKARIAGIVQGCVMSFPLIVVSMKILLNSVMDNESVDSALFHRHMYENKYQFAATSVSFLNLIITAYRYNERLTGRPVAVLVGLPFLVSNIIFRLFGFSLLFSLFEDVWICLCLGILLAMSALSVQLASNFTICGRLFRTMFGDHGTVSMEKKSSIGSSLLLTFGGVLVPVGYTRDLKLGHIPGRGWRLILVNAVGALAILSTVTSTAIVQHIPNTFSGQALIGMIMDMAEMEITIKTGGKELTLDLPKTQLNILADHPARATITLNSHDDMYISYILPCLLAVLCVPFTVLRILLLGWDCRLQRTYDEDDVDERRPVRGAGSGRSCCAVVWSLWSLMSFSTLVSLFLAAIVICAILAHTKPAHLD